MLCLKQILFIWLHLYREYIFKVKRLLFNFKWNTFDRIKRNTLIGDITDRGLSIIDIESKFNTLKAAWIPQIVFSKGTLFEIFESFFLEKANLYLNYVLQFFETNLNALDSIGKFPLFYKQTLSSFNECKQRYNFNNNNVCSYPIFFNVTSYEMWWTTSYLIICWYIVIYTCFVFNL